MERKNKCKKSGFSINLCVITLVFLVIAPCVRAVMPPDYDDGGTHNITTDPGCSIQVSNGTTVNISATISGDVTVSGTDPEDPDKASTVNLLNKSNIAGKVIAENGSIVNMYSGANILWWIQTKDGSTVNITGGNVVYHIDVALGANVTAYAASFAVNGNPTSESPIYIPNVPLTGYDENSIVLFNIVIDCQSDATVTLAVPGPTPIDIDIKPGSYPNSVNINGHGVIPVAILGSADFDVTQIVVNDKDWPLTFQGLAVRVKGNDQPQCSVDDVSGPEGVPDGIDDLVCQFVDDNPDGWESGVAIAELTGFLVDGTEFAGSDEITIVP